MDKLKLEASITKLTEKLKTAKRASQITDLKKRINCKKKSLAKGK